MNTTTIGFDIAKKVFQVHGAGERVLRQLATLPDWDGGLWKRAPLGAEAVRARAHGQADCSAICEAVREGQQERRARCGGNLRGGGSAKHAIRSRQVGRTAGVACATSGAARIHSRAYSSGKSVARPAGRIRDRSAEWDF